MNEEISVQQLSEESKCHQDNSEDRKPKSWSLLKSSQAKRIKNDKGMNQKVKSLKLDIQPEKQCRICLDGEQEGRLIIPCGCSGSVMFIHEKCIKQWIRHKISIQKISTPDDVKIACQMCKIPFNYSSDTQRKLDWETFYKNYLQSRKSYFIFGVVEIILLAIAVGMFFIIVQSGKQSEFGLKLRQIFITKDNLKSVYTSIAIAVLIMFIFLLVLFLIENGVKIEKHVSQVYDYQKFKSFHSPKIYPKKLALIQIDPSLV